MNKPLVSVIITTHEREPRILRRSIESVVNQSYKNIEIFVINDSVSYHLNDEIQALVNSYEKKIYYILNDENPGACGSRNIGIELSKGEYIGLLDDDDEWDENKIEDMLPLFKSKDIGLIYGDIAFFENGKRVTWKRAEKYEGYVFNELLENNFVGGCSVPLIRKECFSTVGKFDECFLSAQDLDMWLRIAKKYQVCHLKKECVRYHISNISITSNYERRLSGYRLLLKKYENDFANNKDAKRVWVRTIVKILVETNNISEANKEFLDNFRGIERFTNFDCILRGIYHLVKK